ncbi:DUF2066 domain-containing protein [Aliidiomarina maris]|uniref:DUF2066 domain-containing protein n=1 Tax=Aliidiomarina maris TaxID=531312 RepID=A0A327WUH3_9GAMM|nr:DUF2066 domain-containing protein [Aliidiomarina maris]RAJ96466.1 hypothetical protein B0I24_10845 [Aliidiomarina maris]RUO23781.1 hypothetical protein CWE07_09735 [Aliidiomarina maris]
MLDWLWLFIIPVDFLKQAVTVFRLITSSTLWTTWIAISIFALTQLSSAHASSTEVGDLYEIRLPVNSQSRDDRQQALQEGFAQVLVKVSGQRDVLTIPAVRSELSRHTNYLVQYNYVTEERQLMLRAQFDERRIEELLRRADATYWSARRPNLMFWVAQESPRGIQLAGRDTDSELIPALRQQSRVRGLPISFPLLDLTDRMLVSPSDVWGRFDAPVLEATQRYPANGVVIVRVQEVDDEVRGQWSLVVGNTRRAGQTQAEDLAGLGQAIMDEVTERVAAEYAVTFSDRSRGDFRIRVTNLMDLERLLEVEAMLGRLGSVERVTLSRYHQGSAEFNLLLIGDMSRALQALELENRMQRVVDPWSTDASPVVEYRWLR